MPNTVVISQLGEDTGDDCGKLLSFVEAALGSSRTFPRGLLPLEKGLLLSQSLISNEIRLETEWKFHRRLCPALPSSSSSSSTCIFHIPILASRSQEKNSQIAVYFKGKAGKAGSPPEARAEPLSEQSPCKQTGFCVPNKWKLWPIKEL